MWKGSGRKCLSCQQLLVFRENQKNCTCEPFSWYQYEYDTKILLFTLSGGEFIALKGK